MTESFLSLVSGNARRSRAGGIVVIAAVALLALGTPRALAGFLAPLSFDTGVFPYSVTVADLDRDGILDLLVANSASDNVSVLLGNGKGTFRPAVNYAVGRSPHSVTVGDFNGDGIPDLVVPNFELPGGVQGTVSVLLGNGDGTFQAAVNYSVGITPRTVAVGDFNGDGILDLAVANEGTSPTYSNGTISVLLGNGDGTFKAPVDYDAGGRPTAVMVGDFNRDGILDLVVTNYVAAGTVSVFLGKGDGTFGAAVTYTAGPQAYAVAVGDFNGDGVQDLAIANGNAAYVSVLIGNGDGTFQPPANYATPSTLASVAVGDFNGDGIPDLAAATAANSIAILVGNGDGTFQAAQSYPVGAGPISVAAGDLNADGILDLVVANQSSNTVNVLLGTGNATFQAPMHFDAGSNPRGVAVGDFNGDGIPDLALANAGGDFTTITPGTVSVLLGKGDGSFQVATNYPTGDESVSVAVGDFNGDGRLDLVVANLASNDVSVLLGNGDGTFQPAVNFAAGPFPIPLVVGDFNNDGKLDLAVGNGSTSGGGTVSILLGNGDGTFQLPVSFAVGGDPQSMVVGDFNGDGIPDLVVANFAFISVLLGKGDGTFQRAVSHAAGRNPIYVAVGDFNGDGILDLAVANGLLVFANPLTVSVLLGKGDGTFHAVVQYYAGEALPGSLAVGDFNGDGHPDLAVVFSGGVRVLLGNGDGAFKTTTIGYIGGSNPLSVAVADFNGDGRPDLALANFDSNNVSILLNDGTWAP